MEEHGKRVCEAFQTLRVFKKYLKLHRAVCTIYNFIFLHEYGRFLSLFSSEIQVIGLFSR